MKKVEGVIRLLRVKHYIKNLTIFIPLVFSGKLLDSNNFSIVLNGYFVFCMVCSCVYIINDIRDIEYDRKSELKKNRPLASGIIGISFAISVCVLLLCSAILLTATTMHRGQMYEQMKWIYPLVYLGLNILYSFGLKNIPIFDVSIIAIGFLIRVLYGGAIINVEISKWVYLTIISGALYLALAKRKNELEKYGCSGRKSLKTYSVEFLDKNMYMCLGLCLVFYALACTDINTQAAQMGADLLWSIPLVLFISLRYNMDVENCSDGDPTSIILGDILLLFFVVALVLGIIIAIYI